MSRLEVNLLLFIACYVAGMTSSKPGPVVVFGVWMTWFGIRATFPRFDAWLRKEQTP